jgi:hypothetical protein
MASKNISPVGLVSLAIADGATTPVPKDGAGSLVWSSVTGTTMVWNGTAWSSLRHIPIGFKYGVTGTAIPFEKYPTTSEYNFTIDQSKCSAKAGTAGSSPTVFTIMKNGSTLIGTFTFDTGQTVATVSIVSGIIIFGDYITIEAPATPDSSLADISFTIRA